jgi:hypothetical protein
MTLLLTAIGSFALCAASFGQDLEVTVRVVDKLTDKAIKNANVVVLGTTRGTATNAIGYFNLMLQSSERTIVITHVSFESEVINIPHNISAFTVPLRRKIFKLAPVDLMAYPNGFGPEEPKITAMQADSLKVVEASADFPYVGGLTTFAELFGNKFQYPDKLLLERQEGKVFFGFTIGKKGEYKDAGCVADSLNAICNEFKRTLGELPVWIPAEQRGEAVEQAFVIPISYGLNTYWEKKLKELKKRNKQKKN